MESEYFFSIVYIVNETICEKEILIEEISCLCRFPLKAVKVMHTVALRTEATIAGGTMPPNLGQAFKVPELSLLYFMFVISFVPFDAQPEY